MALKFYTFTIVSCLVIQNDPQNPPASQGSLKNASASVQELKFQTRIFAERSEQDQIVHVQKTRETFINKERIVSANLKALQSLLDDIRTQASQILRDTDRDLPVNTISEITNKADQALQKAQDVKTAVQDAYTAQNNAKQAIVDAQHLMSGQAFQSAQQKLKTTIQDRQDSIQNAADVADDELKSLPVIQIVLDAMEVVARSQEILRTFKIIEKHTQALQKDYDGSLTLALLNVVSRSINNFITDMHPVFTAGKTSSKKNSVLKNMQLIEDRVVKYLKDAQNIAEKLAIEALNDKIVLNNKSNQALVKKAKEIFDEQVDSWENSVIKLETTKKNL